MRGRYSIIGLEPDLIWRANDGKAEVNRSARSKPDAFAPCSEAPLSALRALIAESRIALPENLPPMAAGVFGYLGYDMVRLMEELPPPNPDPIGIPDAMLIRPTVVIVFDAVLDMITIVTPVRPEAGVDANAAYRRATERLSAIVDALDRSLDKEAAGAPAGPLDVPLTSNTTEQEFKTMVGRAKEYIAAGDIFQVVLSQRFEAPFTLPPFSLYRALRRVNPCALPLLPRLRRLRGRRLEPGNPGARARRHRHDPPDRRHPRRAARRRTRTRRWRRSCSPIRRSAPSI